MTTVEKILKLCNEKGVTPSKMMEDIGLSRATFSSWKIGRTTPKQATLMKISEYFNIPEEQLEGTETIQLSTKEEILLKIFRECSEEQKRQIISSALEISEA